MSEMPASIAKQPTLEPAEDFYRLRKEGIGFIEQMASALWTDYNVHDPGITTLEALCYAITDVAYRIGWDIKDILMPEAVSTDSSQPYPDQAFFTAREILTVNPTTTDDFRRLLIDLQAVRNAWVVCKKCTCDLSYYTWYDKGQLQLGYLAPPISDPKPEPVFPIGLYDALLELEADPELGDLNDHKIEYKSTIHDAAGAHSITLELRFPDIVLSNSEQWALFMDCDADFAKSNDEHFVLTLTQFGVTKSSGLFGDSGADEAMHDSYLLKNWRNKFCLSFEIKLVKSNQVVDFENATLRVFSDSAQALGSWLSEKGGAAGFKAWFEDKGREIFIQQYRKKVHAVRGAINGAKAKLHAYRNLDEDYCSIKVVGIEEVAVCADVEVKPDADIEWVQARIWFELEQYFNSPIRFHTLQELQEAGMAVEDIFNGPALDSGFIKADDLGAASLKSVLSVSDILNRLMDIEGVISVNQLQLTKYDAEGNVVKGAADPGWKDGKAEFKEINKASASWLLFISPQHQPRLYQNLSRFLFMKNGLPFRPRMDEARDTLNQLRGVASRPKDENAENDLDIPQGTFRNPDDYYPVQYSFPFAYGIGTFGLPPHVSDSRRAQARQLKAYLMVFEQLLGNALAQLANTAKLFSLDPAVNRTYFVKEFAETLIKGFDEITNGLDKTAVEELAETRAEFHERRNRFLDHLMARFGEQFSDYALLLSDVSGKQVAQAHLIDDKISFLKNYPQISRDRAKAFDYTQSTFTPANIPGIKKRINLLLGFPDLKFVWVHENHPIGKFRLVDSHEKVWLEGDITPDVADPAEAYWLLVRKMTLPEAYKVVKYTLSKDPTHRHHLHLRNAKGHLLADQRFESRAEAQAMMDELQAWSANERLIVVEHILLRPKFPGDALYKVFPDGGSLACGDADPYSFRLTFVMPGWTTQYTDNLDMRRFAERTIQQETPSHLLGKICWVGNDGMLEDPCDSIVEKMALMEGLTASGEANACDCAAAVYHAYYEVFHTWAENKKLDYFHPEGLFLEIEDLFDALPAASDIDCINSATAPWDEIRTLMVEHFQQVAQHGWQFERFEHAWQQWQKCNAGIDWTEERLHERVQAILKANLLTVTAPEAAVCLCATTILAQIGKEFYDWMESNLKAGKAYEDLPAFASSAISLCGLGVKPEAADVIADFLSRRYNAYREVSYWLWIVVSLLGKLSNTYPGATLHDCDDGSDHNPVRLGSTALGNYPLRTSIT